LNFISNINIHSKKVKTSPNQPMSSLPSISGTKSQESSGNISPRTSQNDALPKLDMMNKQTSSNDNVKKSPRISPRAPKSPRAPQTATTKDKSPRLSPRIKPIIVNRQNSGSIESSGGVKEAEKKSTSDVKIKLISIHNPDKHHHHHKHLVVPILSRRKSKVQTAEETAEEAWKAREKFIAFVPRKVLPQLSDLREAGERCTPLQGVVSFLDVAGFTKLTERLALQADGAERLADIINKLMGQLLGTLKTGDVIK
jgi:hypothetical protein